KNDTTRPSGCNLGGLHQQRVNAQADARPSPGFGKGHHGHTPTRMPGVSSTDHPPPYLRHCFARSIVPGTSGAPLASTNVSTWEHLQLIEFASCVYQIRTSVTL